MVGGAGRLTVLLRRAYDAGGGQGGQQGRGRGGSSAPLALTAACGQGPYQAQSHSATRAAPNTRLPAATRPSPAPQMRKVQEKIGELQAEHAAQIEAVMGQYGALLQQASGGWLPWVRRGDGGGARLGAAARQAWLPNALCQKRVRLRAAAVQSFLPSPPPPPG